MRMMRVRSPGYWQHTLHAFLQLIFVGAGAPVGKEGASREIGALTAGRIATKCSFSLTDRKLMIICGALAGLAVVYQVPLASVFFAFETLALGVSLRRISIVATTTYLAAYIAQLTVSIVPLYQVVTFQRKMSIWQLFAEILLVLLLPPFAAWFRKMTKKADRIRIKDKRIL